VCYRRGELSIIDKPSTVIFFLQYRAKNDMTNSVAAGFVAGGILARNSGPKAAFGGGLAFAAFSAAIDLFLRREPPE
jgi:mitochondrial import inner membrane translocase subunit TIM22